MKNILNILVNVYIRPAGAQYSKIREGTMQRGEYKNMVHGVIVDV